MESFIGNIYRRK